MTEHLTSEMLNLFADGELDGEQMAGVNDHLASCQACTSNALSQMVLKSTAARAGQRYAIPMGFQERLLARASQEKAAIEAAQNQEVRVGGSRAVGRLNWVGWATAMALLLVSLGIVFSQHRATTRANELALVTEASDQHIGVLAANTEPQVLSSDRHTVKPWFQGKIPFSFNLPEGLPEDTKLDGANLAYLHNRPVAQLLYSIGRHRVSVFVSERGETDATTGFSAEHAGFHVMGASAPGLDLVAVSDVDPVRLRGLVDAIAQVQSKEH
jgi:anti-sigma factor RsiW